MKTDCIFFVDTWAEDPHYHVCNHNRSLYEIGKEDNTMCQYCRLWDAYIPQSASEQEKEKAIRWQNMPLGKQPDYHKYFNTK